MVSRETVNTILRSVATADDPLGALNDERLDVVSLDPSEPLRGDWAAQEATE